MYAYQGGFNKLLTFSALHSNQAKGSERAYKPYKNNNQKKGKGK